MRTKRMFVCVCHGVTQKAIEQSIAEGACSLGDIMNKTGAGTCCGCCRETLNDLLGEKNFLTVSCEASDNICSV